MLIRGLPPESLWAHANGYWWRIEHELAAVTAEIGHAAMRATVAGAGGKPPKPWTIPRPSMEPKPQSKPKPADAEEILEWFS